MPAGEVKCSTGIEGEPGQFGRRGELRQKRQIDLHRNGIAAVLERKRSDEHTSELQSLMRISYAVFLLKKNTANVQNTQLESSIHNLFHPNIISHRTDPL